MALSPSVKKNPVGKILLLVFLGLLLLSVAALYFGDSGEPIPSAQKDECGGNSIAYLLALKDGNSIAAAFWKPGVAPKTLFAVHDFDQIKHGEYLQANRKPYKIHRVYYEFEVQSSTKGGFPIRKRRDVVLEPDSRNFGGSPCAIVALNEAE